MLNVKSGGNKVIAMNFVLHAHLLKCFILLWQTNKCAFIIIFSRILFFNNTLRPPLSPSSVCPIVKIKSSSKRFLPYVVLQLFVHWWCTVMKVSRVAETCSWRLTNVIEHVYVQVRLLVYRTSVTTGILTLTLLTWRIWWAPNNASRWQMLFNSAFKGLRVKFFKLICFFCLISTSL